MKLSFAFSALVLGSFFPTACGFQQSPLLTPRLGVLPRLSSSSETEGERMKAILAEESMNTANFAASAKQMQNMTPEGMDQMIKEMDQMSPAQLEQLKAMGMDPNLMKQSMKMMRDNPSMMASVGKMMETMTPEQLLEQSRKAQQQMAKMTPEQVELAAKAAATLSPDQLEAATEIISEAVRETRESGPGSSTDPNVIDSMFRVAEFMSQPPIGGVTFYAFSTLPPIVVLSGDREEDLSKKELAECWADGSLGATRVDRQGFERVWNEVQEYFEDDIMDAARKTASKSKSTSRGSVAVEVVPTAPTPTSTPPVVGSTLTPEQMAAMDKQIKGMSESDMASMLDQMANMTPEQRARMKAMGVDPSMMEKTASLLKSNPMMQRAANAMMKNMSPEQMMKVSQQAQQQMAGMSKEEYEKAMKIMKERGV
jgi:hypothetical protein